MTSSSDKNVALWTRVNAEYTDEHARGAWAADEISWGPFGISESEIDVLGSVDGLDVVELGCGTAYFSAWLARRGARAVGGDPTPAQLATARRMQAEFGLEFPLVEAFAENVPLPDSSFDLVHSEYGASIWADPYRWVPEAARLLRPGGRLVFLHGTPLATLCLPDVGDATTELQRPYFGLHRLEWTPDGGVEFQLTYGGWIDVLRGAGFEIERLVELQAPGRAQRHEYYADFDPEWSRKWPSEEIWVARKRS
ncbi:MAG: class I SAM-dependent methyltransferase [Actinobacteria bacterium]|nr:MAG: class I SAM-dependent methyltransferase [Actinomycetota bacterium]